MDPDGNLNGPRTVATVSIITQCPWGRSATLTVYICQSVERLIIIGVGTVAALYLWIPKTQRKSLTAKNHI